MTAHSYGYHRFLSSAEAAFNQTVFEAAKRFSVEVDIAGGGIVVSGGSQWAREGFLEEISGRVREMQAGGRESAGWLCGLRIWTL